ncbi:MAG TPA: ABC transporter substrate-binding protein [Gammaproteobacteria bacterium]
MMRARIGMAALLVPCLAAAELPSVASINLCTDQLVLTVADPAQILSLSWLSADPEESMLAPAAREFPLNFGAAEELIAIGAEVVVAGSETSPFTRQLLRRLGATVVEVQPAFSLDDIGRNLLLVGEAIGRGDEARRAIAAMQSRALALSRRSADSSRSAIVVRPGGFTIGRNTLANELIALAGLDNRIAELDRWGSLSVETLLVQDPEVVVITSYRTDESSLANSIFSHPGLASLDQSTVRLTVDARYFACGTPESLRSTEALLEQMGAP